MSELLAVIPARKGSKGLPGKALRTVDGIPLVLRTLRTVEAAEIAERIVVSTDCPEVSAFCELRGYEVLSRPDALAGDDVALLPVARHAAESLGWSGDVGIFQPTCPLLRPETLRDVSAAWDARRADWLITASADHHIHWWRGEPVGERLNRQRREPLECESGAAQIMNARYLQSGEGLRASFRIHPREALDIDSPADLLLAERLARAVSIHFIVAAGPRVGSGHYWRCRSLARALAHHDLSWEWRGEPPQWAQAPFPQTPMSGQADLIVFDCLTVDESEIYGARAAGIRALVLEDENRPQGALVVNALLDPDDLRYAVLREEFLCLPEREHREDANRVLVSFGGTDPAGLTRRVSRVLGNVRAVVPGMDVSMAAEMRAADVVVTSQGRTVLEAAATGTPCIAIAANEREARHVRLPGVTYLGLHSTLTDMAIRQTVKATLADVGLRRENAQAASQSVDGKGLDRLVHAIDGLLIERVRERQAVAA